MCFVCVVAEIKMILAFWQWVVQGAVDVDIGANPSAEGAEDDEGVDDKAVKVVDIVETFRLQVRNYQSLLTLLNYFFYHLVVGERKSKDTNGFLFCINLQEQPAFDKKQFITYMKRYIKLLTPKLEEEKQELFKKHIQGATKFLLSKLSDLQLYALI